VKSKSNSSRTIVQFLDLGFHTSLIERCSTCHALGRSAHIPSQFNIVASIGMRGILVHKQYDSQSLSFIYGVALLPIGLDSTLVESRRNTSIASLPGSLVSTSAMLFASPLCIGSLSLLSPYSFFIFQNFSHFHFHNFA